MKRFCCIFLLFALLPLAFCVPAHAIDFTQEIDARSAILMEAETGSVLYENNADSAFPPASVTKVMTMLLVLEAIDAGTLKPDDTVTVSDHASGMGGSQVYLKAGETMSVSDLLKSVIVASANDAAVALAEAVAGSEEAFVSQMNARAQELGMKNTLFKNTNGLDDTDSGHLTSARDIAIMSREVLKHKLVFDYTTIWMDTIRNGVFGLTNTNRLVRFYRGCNGLKTGSTSKAGFCISATAERDGMQLICVVMGAPTKDARNSLAAALLDWGFANYTHYHADGDDAGILPVRGGVTDSIRCTYDPFSALLPRTDAAGIKSDITLPEFLPAPVNAGDTVGSITYYTGDKEIGSVPITAAESVAKIGFLDVFFRMISVLSGG